MINDNKVSIIIPVYNERRYLNKCIDSILNQTYKNIEVIIVDDGSDKDVAEECDRIASDDNRVRVLHKTNEGLSAARISGINMTTGEWIMFADDDDLIIDDAVEKLVSGLPDDVEISTGMRIDLGEADNYYAEHINDKSNPVYETITGVEACELIPNDIDGKIITPLWGKIYRKEFLSKIDLCKYKEQCPTIFFEDLLMTPILLAEAKRVRILRKVIYVHREVATSISRARKMSPYYYEQIASGDILLDYCDSHSLSKHYDYSLVMYYKILSRTYCLIREGNISDEQKEKIKKKIISQYKKWKKEYMKSSDNIVRKFAMLCFGICPNIWGNVVYNTYFKMKG